MHQALENHVCNPGGGGDVLPYLAYTGYFVLWPSWFKRKQNANCGDKHKEIQTHSIFPYVYHHRAQKSRVNPQGDWSAAG